MSVAKNMKLQLPNSAHLQNIEGFFRKFSPIQTDRLYFSMHNRYVYVHPAAREQYQFLMQRDGMVREFEYQVRRRDGGILWLSDSATAVRDERGEVIH